MLASLALAVLTSQLSVDPQTYVGNVYGTVEPYVLVSVGDRVGRADADGHFLINSIPTPDDGRDYTIVVGDLAFNARVLPGATMALEVDAKRHEWHYRHESQITSRAPRTENYTRSIFATREGLVGGTTANGHVIVPNDHFVALPSRRALASNFGFEKQVRLSYQGRTTVQPVWDIGPWNTHDDYWNPPSIRETFKDLPRGLPEAQAAFYNGYNGGRDERGRTVKNPAGIDLADGVYQLDLGLLNNDFVEVEYLWLDAEGPVVDSIATQPGSILAHVSDASPIDTVDATVDGVSVDAIIIGNTVAIPVSVSGTHTISIRARDVYENWGATRSQTVTIDKAPRKRRSVQH